MNDQSVPTLIKKTEKCNCIWGVGELSYSLNFGNICFLKLYSKFRSLSEQENKIYIWLYFLISLVYKLSHHDKVEYKYKYIQSLFL